MITPTLETTRLILRPGKITDAELVFKNWTNDPNVSKFMRWNTHSTVADTAEWLTQVEANVGKENAFDWLFILKESNQPIGSGGVFYSSTHNMMEIGYCLMQKCWGQGLATEAAQRMMDFAIKDLGQTQLYACHAKDNPASGSIIKKLGFVYSNDSVYPNFDGSTEFESCEYFWKEKC